MYLRSNTKRSEVLKAYDEVESDKRKALGKMTDLAAIQSIQISLGQMAAGKTVPAQTVHQRLQGE